MHEHFLHMFKNQPNFNFISKFSIFKTYLLLQIFFFENFFFVTYLYLTIKDGKDFLKFFFWKLNSKMPKKPQIFN